MIETLLNFSLRFKLEIFTRKNYIRYLLILAVTTTLVISPLASAVGIAANTIQSIASSGTQYSQLCGQQVKLAGFGAAACTTTLTVAASACATTTFCPGCTWGIAATLCGLSVASAVGSCGIPVVAVFGMIRQCI